MADVKISQLPAATTPLTGAEQVPLVQGGVTKRTTVLDLGASQTLQTVTSNGASTTINSLFNGANIGTFSGVPAVTSVGSTVGLANSTNAVVLVADAWRGTSNNNINLGASGYNWNNIYGTTFNVGSGTASMTASGNNLVLNAVAAAVAGVGFAPATDNLYFLGGSSLRWKALYLGDGALTWNSYAIPAPTGGTTTFLRNDGTWAVPAGGGGGSGTVTSVSVVSANGLAGTVATATTTPAITLSTSITGVLKGNGTAISAATAGTDYVAPGGALGTPSSGTLTNATGLPLTTGVTGLLPVANGGTGTATPALVAGTNVTITGTWPNQTINASGGGSMTYPGAGIANSTGSAWGTSYSTTGTGTVLALATSPTLVTPVLGTPTSGNFSTGTFTWPTFNQNTSGTAAGLSATLAVASGGTGQTTYTDGQLLIGNTTGNTLTKATLTAGTGVTITNGAGAITINATGTGGTVTSVAALTLGTTGTDVSSTVATGTTTPVITLNLPSASATNRGALTAADWTTFNNKGSGTVTSVGWTGGIVSVATGTTTPAFTIAGTSGGVPYFNSGTTWATSAALAANALVVGGGAGVAPATVTTGTGVVTALGVNTGTAGAFVVNGGALGTPSSGTLTSATGLPLTTGVTGTLPIANGGTGLTTTPANGALDIGNGTGFTRTTLTAGTGITVTNASGAITIAAAGGNTPIGTDLASTDYNLTMPTALASTTGAPVMQAVSLDGTKELMLIGGNSSLQAVVWDGSAFGTMVLVRSGDFSTRRSCAIIALSSTSVLVSSLVDITTALQTVVLSISGTTITVNTAVSTTLGATSNLINQDTRFVACGSSYVLNYFKDGTLAPCFRAITVSGTTPTVGSELALLSGQYTYAHSYAYTSSVLLSLSSDSNNIYVQPISVSGTTLTLGTSATIVNSSAVFVSGVLSSGRVAIAYPTSANANVSCSIISVTTTVASVSTAGTTLNVTTLYPVMQVFGTQAFVLSGYGASDQISVLTDTAGVASVGTPVTPLQGSRMVGYLSTGKVFLSSVTNGNSSYYQYGISSGAAVVEKTFPNVTSTTTIVVQTFGNTVYYNQPLSGPAVSGNNSSFVPLRTSAGKTSYASTTFLPFSTSIDGSYIAKTQQSPYTSTGVFNDGISTTTAWGFPALQSTTTTNLVIRKIVLS